MKKKLGEQIRGELERRSQKSGKPIYAAVHDYLVDKFGEEDAEKLETVKGKWSKLINDRPEGAAYFYAHAHPMRLEALAHGLSLDVQTLQEWRAQDDVPTLILDPRLPVDAIRFLRAQADDRAAMYRVLVAEGGADGGGGIDARIRAQLSEHREAIAVVADVETARLFEFAEHSVTTVHAVPRGFVLDAFPDLVPIPAPAPPRAYDDDGVPVLPLFERSHFTGREPLVGALNDIAQRVIAPAEARGETPCLTVQDAITWYTRLSGPLPPPTRYVGATLQLPVEVHPQRHVRLGHLLGDTNTATAVWVEGKRILAAGPHLAAVAALFAPHHDVTEPDDFADLRSRLSDVNPWQLFDDAKRPDDPLNALIQDLGPWAERLRCERLERLLCNTDGERARLVAQDASSREQLRDLAGYDATAAIYPLLFALDRAVAAPLISFHKDADDACDLAIAADLGGGHLLHVRASKLPGRRTQLQNRAFPSGADRQYKIAGQLQNVSIWEGGDVLVATTWTSDSRLEGSSQVARQRRRAEDQRCDDDD